MPPVFVTDLSLLTLLSNTGRVMGFPFKVQFNPWSMLVYMDSSPMFIVTAVNINNTILLQTDFRLIIFSLRRRLQGKELGFIALDSSLCAGYYRQVPSGRPSDMAAIQRDAERGAEISQYEALARSLSHRRRSSASATRLSSHRPMRPDLAGAQGGLRPHAVHPPQRHSGGTTGRGTCG